MGSDHSLREDMLRMLENPTFCDMVFVCGPDHTELPALRMLVAARSPALEKMLLTSGMAETKRERVPLPEIDPATMHICLEYFYTGSVHTGVHSNSSTTLFSCMNVISAARFFLVPKLEQLTLSYMSSCLSKVPRSELPLVDIAKAYTRGVQMQDDHPNMLSLMQQLNECIVFEAHLSLKCYKHLTEEAFIHLISNLDKKKFSILEYGLFHLAVKWCASQLELAEDAPLNLQAVEDTIRENLPWRSDEVYNLVSLKDEDNNQDANPRVVQVMQLLSDPVVSCLKKLNLDLSKIPTRILSNLIEPLNLLPSSLLLQAYKLQALHR